MPVKWLDVKQQHTLQDPFSDPSQASLTCVARGPVTVKNEAAISGSEGKQIFAERKALNVFQNKVCLSAGLGAACLCSKRHSPFSLSAFVHPNGPVAT